eukprot:5524983-Pyramimonas_sp.AAC.1
MRVFAQYYNVCGKEGGRELPAIMWSVDWDSRKLTEPDQFAVLRPAPKKAARLAIGPGPKA